MEITFHDIEVCDEDGNDRVADVRVTIEDNGIFYINSIYEDESVHVDSQISVLKQEEDGIMEHIATLFKSLK